MKATRAISLHLAAVVAGAACATSGSQSTEMDALASDLSGCYEVRFDRLFSDDRRLGPRGAYRLPDVIELSTVRENTTGTRMVGQREPLSIRPLLGGAIHHRSRWYPSQNGVGVLWDMGGTLRLGLTLEVESGEALIGRARWEEEGTSFDSTDVRLERVLCSEANRPPRRRLPREPLVSWYTAPSLTRRWVEPAPQRVRELSVAVLQERDRSLNGFGVVSILSLPDRSEELVLGWGVRWVGREQLTVDGGLATAFLTDANWERVVQVLGSAPFARMPRDLYQHPDISFVEVETDLVRLQVEGREWVVRLPD